jgi:predicted nucleic acid-binding protein
MELADTSAWTSRHRDQHVEERFNDLVEDGEIAICEVVEFELLISARDGRAFAERRTVLEALPAVSIDVPVWRRATDVLQLLAEEAPLRHRRVKLPDLLVAAAAELAGLVVVHYARDFELIAAATGQSVRALAPLGSL